MNTPDPLRQEWTALRNRLQARQLLQGEGASLSLRIPGSGAMWFGLVADEQPQRVPLHTPLPQAAVHRQVYARRADAGAAALGGGAFGQCLADFGGTLPQVFDEQARHLGPMHPAGAAVAVPGRGNVALVAGQPLCLGTTALRLALNAELFEKCAKAYVLAVAGGGRVRPLPWIVRWVANRRLGKDQQRAAARLQQGLLPEESAGY
ncbi:MAG: hypothetical protein LWW96_03760 [Acidovorax sp.]|uniref:hypothetical protein n=1 Tax=Acidovorax sp. TaxID=1872122 RepID=UPI0025C185E0|nr:hypothetical protein [Acidovorax sp.]MCE1191252.1 hypothetical protein [Acidovorax sp.]